MGHRIGTTLVIFSAIGAALFAIQHNTHLMPNAHPPFTSSRERCFGVIRAGKNDCGIPRQACAGRSPHDAARDEGLLLPAGTCTKIDGSAFKATE
jgi:uncharacterized membrane protein